MFPLPSDLQAVSVSDGLAVVGAQSVVRQIIKEEEKRRRRWE
jgi:hypothetical protein